MTTKFADKCHSCLFLIGVLTIFRTNYIFLAQKKNLPVSFLEKVGPLGGGSWPPGF